MTVDRARLERRIAELSAIGGSGTRVTRLGLSPEEQRARDVLGAWLRARGATVRRDPAANAYGRFGADTGPAILVGSHIDSVPEGGRFDGALGVLCAVEAVEALLDDGVRFRRPVEVVGWCDEEGARFGIGLFGSSAAFGRLPDHAPRDEVLAISTAASRVERPGRDGPGESEVRDDALVARLQLHSPLPGGPYAAVDAVSITQ